MMSGKVKINYILFYKLFCIHKKREENKNEKKSNSYFQHNESLKAIVNNE